ncbi:hypothetical protein [Solirubrobacter soli]|uniref:hypothetical protein n=1 Tax=Solirubrobacter soli TaxID=363832 RepID=UPI0003FCCBB8|nr:hypothetical protein [Solirubrobacter soli]
MTRRVILAPWPAALGASLFLALGHMWGCYRDPSQYGNAWSEDHSGYCTHSSWAAMTSGPAEFLLAGMLLAVTVGLPLVVFVGSAVVTRRMWLVWTLTVLASLGVAVFFVIAGHVTIVGGGGG